MKHLRDLFKSLKIEEHTFQLQKEGKSKDQSKNFWTLEYKQDILTVQNAHVETPEISDYTNYV